MVTLDVEFILSVLFFLFFIGIIGLVLNRKNVLITIISLELMLLAVILNFVMFSSYLDDILGQIFVLFILTIAASESATGLALLTVYYKLINSIRVNNIKKLKI